MNATPLITVALIIAITQFFRTQLNLTGWKVILAAFLVVLVLAYIPVLIAAFPTVAPWLEPLVNAIFLFLAAAGTVDFVKEIRSPK
jgi:hypothetical protein